MKRIKWSKVMMFAAIVVSFLTFCISLAQAEDCIISGYADNEYIVVGPVMESALVCKAEIDAYGVGKAGKLKLTFYGSADTPGTNEINQGISEKRANMAGNEFKDWYPNALVIPKAKGDEANAKQVKVVYVIIPETLTTVAATPAVSQKSGPTEHWGIVTVLVFVMFVVILLAWWGPRAEVKEKIVEKPKRRKFKTYINNTSNPDVKLAVCGPYSVKITRRNFEDAPYWVSPFRNLSGGDRIRRRQLEDIARSISSCFEPGSEFEKQIPDLIESGEITIKETKTEVAPSGARPNE